MIDHIELEPGGMNRIWTKEDRDYVRWLEGELIEIMRLASRGLFGEQKDDSIDDTLRLHGIRLLVEADHERYEALLERVTERGDAANGNLKEEK